MHFIPLPHTSATRDWAGVPSRAPRPDETSPPVLAFLPARSTFTRLVNSTCSTTQLQATPISHLHYCAHPFQSQPHAPLSTRGPAPGAFPSPYMADHEEQASASSVDVPAAVVEQAAASSLSDQHGSTSPTVVSPASSSAASPTATASTAEDTSSSAAPAVDNSADEAARPPPRRLRAPHHRRKNAPLPKSILKHPAPRPSGFSFRRDWLQPLNSRLAYAAAATTAPAQGEPATATATAAGQAIGNAAAGFWGSALKKLSGVTAVAAGVQVPPPRRDLAEDGPGGVTAGSSEGFPVGSGATCTSEKPLHAVADHGVADAASYEAAAHARSPPSAASSSAAPHQPPARSVTTSSAPSSSPYATIRVSSSTAAPSSSQPPPLSVTELKRVRFRMATLKVVYPINGPNGPLAPWEEGLTKKRYVLRWHFERAPSLR